MRTPLSRQLAPLAVIAAAALGACGGSGSGSLSGAGSQEARAETKLADLARCMREHGFDAKVAPFPGGGHGIAIRPGSAHGPEALEAAQERRARR